jgi:hypothetical protein
MRWLSIIIIGELTPGGRQLSVKKRKKVNYCLGMLDAEAW